MNETSNLIKFQEQLAPLLSQINASISGLVDLTLAWSGRDFPTAWDQYNHTLAQLDRALGLVNQAPPDHQDYLAELAGVKTLLDPIGDFLLHQTE